MDLQQSLEYCYILLTFGLSYPVLAFVVTLSIAVEINYKRLFIGKSLEKSIKTDDKSFTTLYEIIKLEELQLKLKGAFSD